MSIYVLDTDTLSLWQHGHSKVCGRLAACSRTELAITVITVQEQLDGWHTRIKQRNDKQHLAEMYRTLAVTVRFLSGLEVLDFTESAIERYVQLQSRKLNIGKMDLRIASIVLENAATLVTRNRRDFNRIPNLVFEDWSE
jgi:tRNA(fMet)-specific endonuclease VapC